MELRRADFASDSAGTGPMARLRVPALFLLGIMFAAILLAWELGSDARFDPPYLFLVLTIIFLGIGSFLVAALAGRAFLRAGTWPVLLLGAGTLTLGVATLLGSTLQAVAPVNTAVTVFNLGALFAAFLHLLGALFTLGERAVPGGVAARGRTMLGVYAGSLAVIVLILVIVLLGWLPPFFQQGKGGTPVRQIVVFSASAMFFTAGIVYLTEHLRSRIEFLYWYALGLIMTSLGLGGILLQTATGTPVNWAARAAQLLSGLYMLAAAWVTFREAKARGLPADAVLAGAFWRQEANMRLLFNSVTDAVIVVDRNLVVTGWNKAAEAVYGWPAEEAIGQVIGRLLDTSYPLDIGEQEVKQRIGSGVVWMGELSQKDKNGATLSVMSSVSPVRDAAGRVIGAVAVNRDITERKLAEEALRRAHDELEQRVAERTEELAASREELRAYSRRLVAAVENERRVLARELHDQAGQALTALKIGLGIVQRDPACPSSVATRLDELKHATDEIMDGLRRMAMDLRPGTLDRAGLVPALKQYLATYREQTGLAVDFADDGLDGRLQTELETNLYRIVQEALTNVARHAHAQSVGVVLQRRDGRILLVIEDDGIGFDQGEAHEKGHLGLINLRERVDMLGGTLKIESAPGRGTTLYVDLPA